MTFWFDSSKNTLVESGDDSYFTETDDGYELDVDAMPQKKLTNIKYAIDQAVDANEED